MMRALFGISIPIADSAAMVAAWPCGTGQTPQMRCAM